MQNASELGSYAMTVMFAKPAEFRYPAVASAVAVSLAAGLFASSVRRKRGHLVHTPACFGGMEMKRRPEAGYRRLVD